MEWFTVIGLVLFGIGLILIEVIFVPGTTVVGIAGLLSMVVGIYLSFDYFDPTSGTIVLILSVLCTVGVLAYAFKSKSWERFSLKDENTGKFNDDFKVILALGDEGQTLSALKPIGKALFGDKEVEVKSDGSWVSENEKVRIIRIDQNKIVVEPIKSTK